MLSVRHIKDTAHETSSASTENCDFQTYSALAVDGRTVLVLLVRVDETAESADRLVNRPTLRVGAGHLGLDQDLCVGQPASDLLDEFKVCCIGLEPE